MDVDDLEGRATLAVVAPGALDAFLHRQIEVGVRQDDGRVLGLEAQHLPHAVGLGVLGNEGVAGLAVANEGEHVHLAGLHDGRCQLTAPSEDDVDHARRKAVAERFEERRDEQHAVLGGLEDGGVAHEDGGQQHAEGLVERVVVRAEAQHDAQRATANLGQGALHVLDRASLAVQLLVLGDGVTQVFHGAGELLHSVFLTLADLPHEELDHQLALFDHAVDELLHHGDAVGGRHGRPIAPAEVVGLAGGRQRLQSLLLLQIGSRAEVHGLLGAIHDGPDGTVDIGHVAAPLVELAVHEVLRVVQRLGDGVLGIEQGILCRNGVGHARLTQNPLIGSCSARTGA